MVDNPLDSNREYLRTSLQSSLINNLLYNERRQKDSIKLFEVSNIYTNDYENIKRVIGIIATGRVGKNYLDFSKKSTMIILNKSWMEFCQTSLLKSSIYQGTLWTLN